MMMKMYASLPKCFVIQSILFFTFPVSSSLQMMFSADDVDDGDDTKYCYKPVMFTFTNVLSYFSLLLFLQLQVSFCVILFLLPTFFSPSLHFFLCFLAHHLAMSAKVDLSISDCQRRMENSRFSCTYRDDILKTEHTHTHMKLLHVDLRFETHQLLFVKRKQRRLTFYDKFLYPSFYPFLFLPYTTSFLL